jgi:hypothetical protein
VSTLLEIGVGAGELLDRLTILRIKSRRLRDPAKRDGVAAELDRLGRVREQIGEGPRLAPLEVALGVVNDRLWTTEDRIREHESRNDFGPRFVELARSIYRLNDLRHSLKCEVDALFGSVRSEEKEYAGYQRAESVAAPRSALGGLSVRARDISRAAEVRAWQPAPRDDGSWPASS